MRFLVSMILGLLVISMIPTSVSSEIIVHNSAPENSSITIALSFLNFDDRINLEMLDSYLPSTVDNTYTNFEISYEITQLSASINESITDYWDTNGPLMEHSNVDFNPSLFGSTTDVFVNKTGRAVDAREFEKWFSTITPAKTADYSLYLLNLTHIDDGYSHWFSLATEDVDSNSSSTGFYSKTTNLHSKPTVGFGGSFDRSYFLDLSSYHWYPNWIDSIWGDTIYPYIETTVQEIVIQEDIDTSVGQDTIRSWIADWVIDIERNNFVGYVNPPMIVRGDGEPVIYPTVETDVLILSNLTDYGHSLESLEWMTSEARIEQPLMELAPFVNWEANVRYEELSSYADLYERFNNEAVEGEGNIEVIDGFLNYISSYLSILFPEGEGDIGFPTIIFMTNSTSMSLAGKKFAGLGGMGWQLMNINPSRVYRLN
ncbi:MAG: hypothetical protein KAR35_09975, partial [Candidatus Heimdallarchaeota archaeon]|nr:hypothetical protein [Candidatus Heimdallarchaeota archaeon]MCK5049683.1 hypothetical protein [Candidatus Heimdallarchaeota archaeon]